MTPSTKTKFKIRSFDFSQNHPVAPNDLQRWFFHITLKLINFSTEHLQCYSIRKYKSTDLWTWKHPGAFPMVRNYFSKAVLFCVPAQVTPHTHYLLMQLTFTCLAWHGPYHLSLLFFLPAVHSRSGRTGQAARTASTAEFGKCCVLPSVCLFLQLNALFEISQT